MIGRAGILTPYLEGVAVFPFFAQKAHHKEATTLVGQ